MMDKKANQAQLRLKNHRDPQRLVCVLFQIACEVEKTLSASESAGSFAVKDSERKTAPLDCSPAAEIKAWLRGEQMGQQEGRWLIGAGWLRS